jgi:beta-lactamase class A
VTALAKSEVTPAAEGTNRHTALAVEAGISAGVLNNAAVTKYLEGCGGDVTAAVYDEVTGTTSLYRPGIAEDTASIMKVDILATLLAQAQADDTTLNPGQQDLAQEMIEQSNDDDAQDLWDSEGGATAVSAYDTAAGLTGTTPDEAGYWGLSTTTAADQVTLLKSIAYVNDLLSSTSRAYELGLMTDVDPDQAWGVSEGVPPGVTVAIKDGWLPLDAGGWQINSIGYVNGDGRDYLIAVLTSDATEAQGIATIDGLSALVWPALAPAA